ncbi:hypothetical protein [Pseudaestuariivita rosea]|nr:hypothetical protein [Pseudaestuariivita rosea]
MSKRVYGISAPTPRITKTAAFLVATVISVPVFVLLTLVDWVV